MRGKNFESNIARLNGKIMIFDKNKTNFKIYNNVEKSNEDKDFSNPINISEFNLLKELITCEESNIRYNSSRIVEAKISHRDFSENGIKDLLCIVTGQLKTEKNLRIKAVISSVLGRSLSISKEEQNEIKSKNELFDDILDFFAQSPNLVSQNPKVKLAQLGHSYLYKVINNLIMIDNLNNM